METVTNNIANWDLLENLFSSFSANGFKEKTLEAKPENPFDRIAGLYEKIPEVGEKKDAAAAAHAKSFSIKRPGVGGVGREGPC